MTDEEAAEAAEMWARLADVQVRHAREQEIVR